MKKKIPLKKLLTYIRKYKLFTAISFLGVSTTSSLNIENYKARAIEDKKSVDYLRAANDSLRKRNRYQRNQIENLSLVRLSVENCLEVFPTAAFVKVYDEKMQMFVMYDMNPKYVSKYLQDVSKSQYLMNLDEVAHSSEKASIYRAHDMEVLAKGSPETFWEPAIINGELVWEQWHKWMIKRDGTIFLYGFVLER